jgi:putative ABC transport system permease protein
MFLENLRIALRAILANKMRSILTVLGVMIGVAAVIAVVSLVQGLQYKLSNDVESIGSNYIEVFPDPGEDRNTSLQKMPELTIEDAEAVHKSASAIRQFTPIFLDNVDYKSGGTSHRAQLWAVNSFYQDIFNRWVEHGRFYNTVDEEAKKRVAIIGSSIASKLKLDDPIGKEIRINGQAFTVIGVLESKGGMFGQDQDDVALIPFSTAVAIYGPENMKRLVLAFQMRNGSDLDLAREQVTEVLRNRHHLQKGKPDDFKIIAQEQIAKFVSTALGSTTAVMAAVVGIALLVGGIGIMNIMLVSVTERTREIGVRKSIGARRRDVLIQFLVEAVALSGFGGAVGITGGYLLAATARTILNRSFPALNLPPAHTPFWAILLAFSFCAFLGVMFGIYPAAKASKLDPIEALRYE